MDTCGGRSDDESLFNCSSAPVVYGEVLVNYFYRYNLERMLFNSTIYSMNTPSANHEEAIYTQIHNWMLGLLMCDFSPCHSELTSIHKT